MMKVAAGAISLLLFASAPALAAHTHPEKWYQEKWCADQKGEAEVRLPDATRVDCITTGSAIEFDFAHKWYEAVGQALYYGTKTGKRPGVVLILESQKDRTYFKRMNDTINHYKLPIDTWEMDGTQP